MTDIHTAWAALPTGARAALDAQWRGVAAGGLPCGAAVTDSYGNVLAIGRNHAYDRDDGTDPLANTALAHAEVNALARIATSVAPETLTIWCTQHPCSMCAGAISFIGIGHVVYLADDPSEQETPESVIASRGAVAYRGFDDPAWARLTTMLFDYRRGELAVAAGNGTTLPDALADVWAELQG